MTSYLRDTTDFLNNIPENVPKDTILVSFDIESIFSNIPHALGLEAVDYWLEKYPETLNPRFTKEFILDGIKLILENIFFVSMIHISNKKRVQRWVLNSHQCTQP